MADLTSLAPKGRFIAAEAVERDIWADWRDAKSRLCALQNMVLRLRSFSKRWNGVAGILDRRVAATKLNPAEAKAVIE
jgi:hypothetical protein